MTPGTMAALHGQCFTTAPRAWTATEFETYLRDPDCVVVTQDSGFAIARVAAGEAELLTIAVAPKARRTGVATALLNELHALAGQRGAVEIFLEVSETNHAARLLYERAGYYVVGKRPDYYRKTGQPPETAIIMKMAVSEGHGEIVKNG